MSHPNSRVTGGPQVSPAWRQAVVNLPQPAHHSQNCHFSPAGQVSTGGGVSLGSAWYFFLYVLFNMSLLCRAALDKYACVLFIIVTNAE